MKRLKYSKALLFLAIVVILLANSAWSQKAATNIGPKYDAASEVKLKGTVEEVKLIPGPGEGTHLVLKSGADMILVHIAPETFLKELEMGFAKGDQVEIVGSKLKIDGTDEVLAREVTRGTNSLTLRDKTGTPIWSLWNPAKK